MPRKKTVVSTVANELVTVNNTMSEQENIVNDINIEKQPVVKKRGRRPKGGKIITTETQTNMPVVTMQENIILHLRCSLEDIKESNVADISMTNYTYTPEIENVQAYSTLQIFGNASQSTGLKYHELTPYSNASSFSFSNLRL